MTTRERVSLAEETSLRVGGPARFFIGMDSDEDLARAVEFARARRLPLRILGAGTNVLVPDAGVEGVVARFASFAPISFSEQKDGVLLVAAAGVPWDTVVEAAGERGLWGVENLAGIPGSAGGALVQNAGAYGNELAHMFCFADAFDLKEGAVIRVAGAYAALAYRSSIFKKNRDLVILRLALLFKHTNGPNLSYADLSRAKDAHVPLATPREVARAVRVIRAAKLPGPLDGGTAGSFFKNPVVSREQAEALRARYVGLPTYPADGTSVKLSLAWLLDHALGLKGYAQGPVRLFERQPLALVTSPGASAANIDTFARAIEKVVYDKLGIVIEREVEMFLA